MNTNNSTEKLLSGKIVVFTGTLSMPRKEATMMAERSGATVVGSVTNACNVIVAGSGAGSKLNDAASKGIEVWTEAEFHNKVSIWEIHNDIQHPPLQDHQDWRR